MISELSEVMLDALPNKTLQRNKCYRPSLNEAHHYYELINYYVLNSHLYKPVLMLRQCRGHWGICLGNTTRHDTGSYCEIHLSDKWYCKQWFITILAHEMIHQYQYDIIGPETGKYNLMSHGPTFFQFRENLANHGIPLKTAHSTRKWFKYQNLFKC